MRGPPRSAIGTRELSIRCPVYFSMDGIFAPQRRLSHKSFGHGLGPLLTRRTRVPIGDSRDPLTMTPPYYRFWNHTPLWNDAPRDGAFASRVVHSPSPLSPGHATLTYDTPPHRTRLLALVLVLGVGISLVLVLVLMLVLMLVLVFFLVLILFGGRVKIDPTSVGIPA